MSKFNGGNPASALPLDGAAWLLRVTTEILPAPRRGEGSSHLCPGSPRVHGEAPAEAEARLAATLWSFQRKQAGMPDPLPLPAPAFHVPHCCCLTHLLPEKGSGRRSALCVHLACSGSFSHQFTQLLSERNIYSLTSNISQQ